MASVVTIPRFLLPRGAALFRPTQTPARANLIYQCLTSSSSRHASTSKAKPSSTVLAKPDRFNPPSHPSKLVKSAPIRQYGPAVTEDQKQVHRSKQYPHSAPPKGSFMDRFIHNRVLHTMIALVRLPNLLVDLKLTKSAGCAFIFRSMDVHIGVQSNVAICWTNARMGEMVQASHRCDVPVCQCNEITHHT